MKGFGRLVKAMGHDILTFRHQISIVYTAIVGASVDGRLTPRTLDLGVRSRPSRCLVRQGTLLHFVSLQPGPSCSKKENAIGFQSTYPLDGDL